MKCFDSEKDEMMRLRIPLPPNQIAQFKVAVFEMANLAAGYGFIPRTPSPGEVNPHNISMCGI